MNRQSLAQIFLAFVVLTACADKESSEDVKTLNFEIVEGCDPVEPSVCAFPWPSSYFQVPDPDKASGHRFHFGPETLPKSEISGEPLNPALFKHVDGYGLGSQIYTLIPDLSDENLPNEKKLAESIEADSPVLLLEVGQTELRRVSCWAELDSGEMDPAKKRSLSTRLNF